MAKYSVWFLGILILLITIASASATLSTDLTSGMITIGSNTQKASDFNTNPSGEYATAQLIVETANMLSIDVAADSPYTQSSSTVVNNINVTIDSQVVVNSNSTVVIKARIPEALDAVNASGHETSFKVGTIILNDGSDTVIFDLYMQRISQLGFDRVEMKFADDIEKITNNEKIDELKPDDSTTVEFKVENTFPSSSNLEIDDVTIYINDDDNDLDIDEDESLGTIRDGDDDIESISFSIPDDIDEGTYDLFFRVNGVDEYDAIHGELMVIRIEIDREKDDISLKRIDLSPDSVNLCDSRIVKLTVSIENIGSNDQDEAGVSVESSNLGYYNIIDNLELEEEDAKTKVFSIPVSPSQSAGAYSILVSAINDDVEITDQKTLTLLVSDCYTDSSQTTNTQTTTQTSVLTGSPVITDVTSAQAVGGHVEFDDEKSETPLAVLLVLFVILLALTVGLIAVIFKK